MKVYCPERFPADRRLIAALRFWRGAGAMQRLRGREGIVTILEGPSVAVAGSAAYIWCTMPLVEGGDLGRALEVGRLSEDERLSIRVASQNFVPSPETLLGAGFLSLQRRQNLRSRIVGISSASARNEHERAQPRSTNAVIRARWQSFATNDPDLGSGAAIPPASLRTHPCMRSV